MRMELITAFDIGLSSNCWGAKVTGEGVQICRVGSHAHRQLVGWVETQHVVAKRALGLDPAYGCGLFVIPTTTRE